MQKRGEVFIAPEEYVPGDGSMTNPVTSRFWVSWQDEAHSDGVIEDDHTIVGANAAIEWGQARSEVVWIRLGNRGDTYFSAGVQHPSDDDPDSEYVPHWPPAAPPTGGWWEPPPKPDRSEIQAIRNRVESGELQAADARAWAELRLNVYSSELDHETLVDLVTLIDPA